MVLFPELKNQTKQARKQITKKPHHHYYLTTYKTECHISTWGHKGWFVQLQTKIWWQKTEIQGRT